MKLKKLKSTIIPHIEGVDLSENYLALFTGQRAVVLNRRLEIIHDIRNLRYIYDGKISPNEKSLLLAGTGNNIMLYSLETSEIYDKVTLRKPFNGNIEGRAIWSNDGERLFVIAQNEETITNIVRIYNAKDLTDHNDLNIEGYLMYDFCPVENDQYSVFAYKRNTQCSYIILFDNEKIKVMILNRFGDLMLDKISYDHVTELFELNGWSNILFVEKNCKVSSKPVIPPETTIKENFKKIIDDKNNSDNIFEYLKEMNLLEKVVTDGLKKIVSSKNGKYTFVVTNMELIVLSNEKREVLCTQKIDLDVKGFQEFDDEVLIINSSEELIIYKLI